MGPADYPVILTYHSISDGPLPTQIAAGLFTEQMEWLHANARVAPLAQVVSSLIKRIALPKRTVALTFDDGYHDFYSSAAPVLRRLKMPATIFLTTGFCGGGSRPGNRAWRPDSALLDWNKVADLAHQGFEFGGHSVSHSDLTTLTSEEALREMRDSRSEIEERTGRTVDFFAYPFGRWSAAIRTVVQYQYWGACSTCAGVVQPEADPFALPRIDAHYLRRPASLHMMFTSPFLAYVATRRLIRRIRRQPEGIYATV
jgi:peptidoglycan/xylan/chitin deacetylase (PgdA/CDA1 family)